MGEALEVAMHILNKVLFFIIFFMGKKQYIKNKVLQKSAPKNIEYTKDA